MAWGWVGVHGGPLVTYIGLWGSSGCEMAQRRSLLSCTFSTLGSFKCGTCTTVLPPRVTLPSFINSFSEIVLLGSFIYLFIN